MREGEVQRLISFLARSSEAVTERRGLKRSFLIFSAIVAFVLFFGTWDSSIFPRSVQAECDYTQVAGKYECRGYHLLRFCALWFEAGIKEFDKSLTLLIAFVVMVFTGVLWRTTDKLRDIAGNQLRYYAIKEQAFVLPKLEQNLSFIPIEGEGDNSNVEFRIEWMNTGSTPAINVLTHVNQMHLVGELPAQFPYNDFNRRDSYPNVFISAGTSMYSSYLKLRDSTAQSIIDGQLNYFIWGWIEYDSLFPGAERQRMQFCWKMTIRGRARGAQRNVRMVPTVWGPFNQVGPKNAKRH